MTINNLGLVTSKMGDHDVALRMYKRAIRIRAAVFGPEHPDVALFLFNLGVCYGKANTMEHSLPCLLEALRIRQRVYGPNHAATLVVQSWIRYYNWFVTDTFTPEALAAAIAE